MRIRVSPEQYSLLLKNTENARKKGRPAVKPPRVRKRRELLHENQLEAQITGFLRLRGWVCTKQHAGVFQRNGQAAFTIGERGIADWRAERPIIPPGQRITTTSCFDVELFYFETKAPGQKPQAHQKLWLERRQHTGLSATWFDSFSSFSLWYRQRYGARAGDRSPAIGET